MSTISVIINHYDHVDVVMNNKILYNVNNLWVKKDLPRPDNYDEEVHKTHICHWISVFHSQYHVLTLGALSLKWMKEASEIGLQTKKFPHAYDKELHETCQRYRCPEGS